MYEWIGILLPYMLLLTRVSAFIVVMPIFSSDAMPKTVRVGLALVLSIFFGMHLPPMAVSFGVHWMSAIVLILQELAIGVAVGLAARLVFLAVQQGGIMATQQMGFADAGTFNPMTGDSSQPISGLLEYTFILLFLAVGGHHLLLMAMARSFEVFPIAQAPDPAQLAAAVVDAGSTMLLFALRLAAPVVAGFLALSVLLSIMAKVLPEMNILMASFPLRVGVGIIMAAAIVPTLDEFTMELARWMDRFLMS